MRKESLQMGEQIIQGQFASHMEKHWITISLYTQNQFQLHSCMLVFTATRQRRAS